VARRRYGKPSGAAADTRPTDPAPEPPAAPSPQGTQTEAKPDQPAEAISNLKAQLDQQRAYQQQPPPQQQVDPLAMYLASIPGLSPHKFYFLHSYFSQHPDRLNMQHWDILKAAHHIATQDRGVQEDSPEYFGFLHSLLHQQAAASLPPHHQAAPAPAPEPPSPVHESRHEPVTIDLEAEHSDSGQPDEAHHMASFISAPVSRDPSQYAVEHQPSEGSVRLTAEQRDIAHRSNISETEYARQLIRMQKMKRSKLISD
jgi:hypothetical protein